MVISPNFVVHLWFFFFPHKKQVPLLQQQVSSMRLLSGAPYNIYIYIYFFFFSFLWAKEERVIQLGWRDYETLLGEYKYESLCISFSFSFSNLLSFVLEMLFMFCLLKVTPSSLYIVKVINELHMNFVLTKLKLRLTQKIFLISIDG